LEHSGIFISTKDFLITGESFQLREHEYIKELLVTFPRPQEQELSKYYESEEYISHTDSKSGFLAKIYQLVKKWSLQKKVALIHKQNGNVGTLLDIGAGTGDFLKIAKGHGWKVEGMEPNGHAADLAKAKGIDLKNSLKNFSDQNFDVVTLWHVLEHIPDLEKTVSSLSKLVKKGGSLIIAVPNYKSYDARFYGAYWAAFDVPRHLWHFSRNSIEHLLTGNFTLENVRPMIFDSFYVSLLSEKYKTGRKFSFRAIAIGLLSNLKGFSSKEYSSHIYCFRKL